MSNQVGELSHDGRFLHAFHAPAHFFQAKLRFTLLFNTGFKFSRAHPHKVTDTPAVKSKPKNHRCSQYAPGEVFRQPIFEGNVAQISVVFDFEFAVEPINRTKVGGYTPMVTGCNFLD